MTDAEKRELELELLMAQIENLQVEREKLRAETDRFRQQMRWETPRNIALIVGVLTALFSAFAGFVGYKIGQTPPAPIVIQLPPQAPR